MTKKFLLAALVAGIFTANNGFAMQNNNQNTEQNSLVTTEEQVTEEEENNKTIFTPVNCAIGAVATAAVVIGAYFGLKKFADIDLYSKLSNLFRKQAPKVENNQTPKVSNDTNYTKVEKQAPKVENKPSVENKAPETWLLSSFGWPKHYVRNTIGDIWTKIQNKLFTPETASTK